MSQRLRIAPVRQCGLGKRRFYREEEAVTAAKRLAESDRFNRPTAGPVAVYRCEECGAWHVGHLS